MTNPTLTQDSEEQLEQIVTDAFNGFYDYIVERDIVKAAHEYSEKTVYKSTVRDLRAWRDQEVVKAGQPAENYLCCEELEAALGDYRGLYSQTIGSRSSNKLDSIILYIGGEYKFKNPTVVQYCPFCGKPRRRASQYKKEEQINE